VAHVGKLYPVAFRRDLNLNQPQSRYYLARAYTFTFQNIFGSWGLTLDGVRFVQLHETTAGPGQFQAWSSGPIVHGTRTFTLNMWAAAEAGYDYLLSGQVIDSILGNFGFFRLYVQNSDRYDQLRLNGEFVPPPHGPIFNGFSPVSGILLLPIRWSEYNVLNP
jgi:hypothetical protein